MQVKNSVIVITGGAQGLGLAMADHRLPMFKRVNEGLDILRLRTDGLHRPRNTGPGTGFVRGKTAVAHDRPLRCRGRHVETGIALAAHPRCHRTRKQNP